MAPSQAKDVSRIPASMVGFAAPMARQRTLAIVPICGRKNPAKPPITATTGHAAPMTAASPSAIRAVPPTRDCASSTTR